MLYLDYQNSKYLLGMVGGMFQKAAIYISYGYGSEKPFTKNCAVGKVLSSLVSVKTRISICCITISFNYSNLFGSEIKS